MPVRILTSIVPQAHDIAGWPSTHSMRSDSAVNDCENGAAACSWPGNHLYCVNVLAPPVANMSTANPVNAIQPPNRMLHAYYNGYYPRSARQPSVTLLQDSSYKASRRTPASRLNVLPVVWPALHPSGCNTGTTLSPSVKQTQAVYACPESLPFLLNQQLVFSAAPPPARAAMFYVPSATHPVSACAIQTPTLAGRASVYPNAQTPDSTTEQSKQESWADSDALICAKHETMRKGRRQPAKGGRRKFRCDVCTAILSDWTAKNGLHPSTKEKEKVLQQIGMSRTQLNNWLDNRRRARLRTVRMRTRKQQGRKILFDQSSEMSKKSEIQKELLTSSRSLDVSPKSRILSWLDSVCREQTGLHSVHALPETT